MTWNKSQGTLECVMGKGPGPYIRKSKESHGIMKTYNRNLSPPVIQIEDIRSAELLSIEPAPYTTNHKGVHKKREQSSCTELKRAGKNQIRPNGPQEPQRNYQIQEPKTGQILIVCLQVDCVLDMYD